MQSDIQIGIVSWGGNCAFLPGVFARVSRAYDWMADFVCEESNDPPGNLCNRPYCILITTGSNRGDSGPLNVLVDKGNDYSPVTMSGKFHGQYYAESEVVLDQYFATLVGTIVNNPTNNAWVGSILLSTDGKQCTLCSCATTALTK